MKNSLDGAVVLALLAGLLLAGCGTGGEDADAGGSAPSGTGSHHHDAPGSDAAPGDASDDGAPDDAAPDAAPGDAGDGDADGDGDGDVPNPDPNRYHWNGSEDPFFEGWYYKLKDQATGQSFFFIYGVQNPATPAKNTSAMRIPGSRFTSGTRSVAPT